MKLKDKNLFTKFLCKNKRILFSFAVISALTFGFMFFGFSFGTTLPTEDVDNLITEGVKHSKKNNEDKIYFKEEIIEQKNFGGMYQIPYTAVDVLDGNDGAKIFLQLEKTQYLKPLVYKNEVLNVVSTFSTSYLELDCLNDSRKKISQTEIVVPEDFANKCVESGLASTMNDLIGKDIVFSTAFSNVQQRDVKLKVSNILLNSNTNINLFNAVGSKPFLVGYDLQLFCKPTIVCCSTYPLSQARIYFNDLENIDLVSNYYYERWGYAVSTYKFFNSNWEEYKTINDRIYEVKKSQIGSTRNGLFWLSISLFILQIPLFIVLKKKFIKSLSYKICLLLDCLSIVLSLTILGILSVIYPYSLLSFTSKYLFLTISGFFVSVIPLITTNVIILVQMKRRQTHENNLN